jgi:hypothetical protein
MNTDILDHLRAQSGRVFSVKEVSKEVDRDRYERDPIWAAGDLKGLCSRGLIEAINGCYWVPEEEDKNAARLEEERIQAENERIQAMLEEEKREKETAAENSELSPEVGTG